MKWLHSVTEHRISFDIDLRWIPIPPIKTYFAMEPGRIMLAVYALPSFCFAS